MFAYQHIYVRLLARLNDGNHVVVTTVDPKGDAMRIIVMSRDCQCWEKRCTEATLLHFKDTIGSTVGCNVPWPIFFDMFQKAFVERSIEFLPDKLAVTFSLRHDRATDAFPASPFMSPITVHVKLADAAGPTNIDKVTSWLLEYMPMRLGDRKEQDRLDDASRQADDLREDCDKLMEEVDLLVSDREKCTAEVAAAEREIAELQAQLDLCQTNDVSSTWRGVVDSVMPSQVLCHVRDPLAGISALPPWNMNLLRALKHYAGFHMFIGDVGVASGLLGHRGAATPTATPASASFLRCCNVVPEDTSLSPGGSSGYSARGRNSAPGGRNSSVASHPDFQLTAEEEAVMATIGSLDDWGNFDATELEKQTRKCSTTGAFGALFYLGYFVMMRLGLAARFNISEEKMLRFLLVMERSYRSDLPFHNSVRAAEVVYAAFYIMTSGDFAKKARVHDVGALALFLACIALDCDHGGHTNTTHQRAGTLLSIVHADQSALESHHAAFLLEIMAQNSYNILDCVPLERAEAVRNLVAEFILASDAQRGAGVIRCAQKMIYENTCDLSDHENCAMLCCVVVIAADAAYAARPTHIYTKWVHGLLQEQAATAALEAKLGISPLSVPTAGSAEERANAQLAFLHRVTHPAFSLLCELLPALRATGEFVGGNKSVWGAA